MTSSAECKTQKIKLPASDPPPYTADPIPEPPP
jgi:hypothetical protein